MEAVGEGLGRGDALGTVPATVGVPVEEQALKAPMIKNRDKACILDMNLDKLFLQNQIAE